jgi:hypothetical protein
LVWVPVSGFKKGVGLALKRSPTPPQLKTRWAIPPKANPAKRGRALGRVALQYSQKLLENNDKGRLTSQKNIGFFGALSVRDNNPTGMLNVAAFGSLPESTGCRHIRPASQSG